MRYERTLALEPARLDELNRLLETSPTGRAEGAILERFGAQFSNEYAMQLWIVNCEPEPAIQVVLWDCEGNRVGTSDFLPGPVEGRYELEYFGDSYVMRVYEGQ